MRLMGAPASRLLSADLPLFQSICTPMLCATTKAAGTSRCAISPDFWGPRTEDHMGGQTASVQTLPTDVFAALAEPVRVEVITRLAECGPLRITDLAAGFPISRQAVSKHIEVLEQAGLLVGQRRGRERFLSLTPRPLANAVSWMASLEQQW